MQRYSETSEGFKRTATPAVRISHYPLLSWHKEGKHLGTSHTSTVAESIDRRVETDSRKLFPKPLNHTHLVVKKSLFNREGEAYRSLISTEVAMRIPGANIKQPTIKKLADGNYQISIVMGKLTGKTLQEWLFADDHSRVQLDLTWTLQERLEILLELALDLQFIHACGIVHRDIKPGNVMVDFANLKAFMFDFDRCKLASRLEGEDESCGTPLYMPPETLAFQPTSFSADVWGFGWIVYLVCDGRMPQCHSIDDVRRLTRELATSFQEKYKHKLFSKIGKELSEQEKQTLIQLLTDTFRADFFPPPFGKKDEFVDVRQRCELQHCVDVLEKLVVQPRFGAEPQESHVALQHAHSVAKTLRSQLMDIAFNTKISDDSPIEPVKAYFNAALSSLQLEPITLARFLKTLHVSALHGLTTVEDVHNKVLSIMDSFSIHYYAIKQYQQEMAEQNMFLSINYSGHPVSVELNKIKQSVDYLLNHYEPYCWALDSLLLVDHKLVKMIDRVQPIVNHARLLVEQKTAEMAQPKEWMRFLNLSDDVEPNSSAEMDGPPTKKQRRY